MFYKIRNTMIIMVAFLYRFLKTATFRRKRSVNVFYPLDQKEQLWYSKLMFPIGEWGYCAQFYKQRWHERPELLIGEEHLPAEVLLARKFSDSALINTDFPCLLPIAVKKRKNSDWNADKQVNVFVNNNMHPISDVVEERYYYLNISEEGIIRIESKGSDLYVGKALPLKGRTGGLKLVLPIFIDGLSYSFFRFGALSEIMPNTHNFFSKGTIFHNCYTTSEWSLTSLASIFTGLTTQHHGIFHPQKPEPLHKDHKILSEYFQSNGFLTTQICGNWRKNPSIGYARGFDRTIYKREIECTEVITEFLDFMHGFKNQNIMAWLTFFDIHRPWSYRIPSIGIQPLMEVELHGLKDLVSKSVNAEYDDLAIRAYLYELKRVDYHLGILYDFIEKNYSDNEILIALLSDHGQSYLDDDGHILADARIRVPLMFRGRNVPQLESDEYVQNTDILPSLLHLAGLQMPQVQIDGILPKCLGGENERDYIFSESLFPKTTYKCIFKDKCSRYVFESEQPVSDDGRVDTASIHLAEVKGKGLQADHYESLLRQYLDNSCFRNKN